MEKAMETDEAHIRSRNVRSKLVQDLREPRKAVLEHCATKDALLGGVLDTVLQYERDVEATVWRQFVQLFEDGGMSVGKLRAAHNASA